MKKTTGWNIFLGLLLGCGTVVADVGKTATGPSTNADMVRRGSKTSTPRASLFTGVMDDTDVFFKLMKAAHGNLKNSRED